MSKQKISANTGDAQSSGHDHGHDGAGGDKGWADSPIFIRGFLGLLIIASIAAAAAGFNPDWHNPHPHFTGEHMSTPWGGVWHALMPVFFALYGFAAFVFIVLAGQHLRKLVARDEDYYDERE